MSGLQASPSPQRVGEQPKQGSQPWAVVTPGAASSCPVRSQQLRPNQGWLALRDPFQAPLP